MKKFISIAATLLLAASFNTAFAEYYLSGEFNNWGRKSFVGNTLIMDKKIRGEFKIIDNDTWYGAYQNNTLTSANPSATLDVGNASNLNLEFPSVYTFTISENNGTKTLTVSGFPTEGFYITGNFNDWKPEEMTKNSDGTYSIEEQLNDHALLKFRDYEGKWYDGVAEGNNDYWVQNNSYSNISLKESNSEYNRFYFEHGGTYTFIVNTTDKKFTVLGFFPTVKLSDNSADNSTTIAQYNEQKVDVVLNGRTLVGGQWNTICLPFEVGNENGFGGTPLADADVREFYNSSLDGGTLSLTFNEANSISPGVPCIVWPTSTVTNPIFTGVTIVSGLAPVGLDEDYVKFIGTFNPENINGQNYLYLGANNTLYYPSSEVTIGAFRAYFKLNGITAGEPLPGQQGIKSFVLNFGDDNEETSIKQINNTESATNTYFTLDGRRLNDKPATAGLYIINGKKVVIK